MSWFRRCLAFFLLGFSGHALAVSSADCAQEQQAYIHASTHGFDGNKEWVRSGAEDIRMAIVEFRRSEYSIPYQMAGANNQNDAQQLKSFIDNFIIKPLQRYEDELRSYQTSPRKGILDPRTNQSDLRAYIALERMKLCFGEIRMRELSGGRSSASSATKSEQHSQCSTDAANREMQVIDQRLGDFLESTAGRQTGIVTPSLQAVMWGTSKQAEVIKKYCRDDPYFKARLVELNDSYQAALAACRQINRSPRQNCVPAVP